MPKKKPVPIEDLIIPPQDQRICGIICVCQMIAVLSCVSLVYLTVAIYKPSIVAFQSGITEVPVMCTTTRGLLKNNCSWESCGEWCLSKTSGQCMQIYVHLRRNGTNVALASCVNSTNKTCYGIDQETAHKSRCIKEECKNLTGTFNCTDGQCMNITDAFKCTFEHTDKKAIKCSGIKGKTICKNITGLYDCHRGQCERIVPPYNCDRRCVDIPTRNKNLIFLSSDKVFLSQCQQALELETGVEIWNASSNSVFMASCYAVVDTPLGIEAYDCIDGTLLDPSVLTDLTNFTYLLHLNAFYAKPVEDFKEFVPPEMSLTIANESKLKINLEGCVNTLMDECKEFFKVYGKDGSDYNARARFPCFYSELDMSTALARFSMSVAWKQFLIASIIPSVLFVVSCITLISCQRTVIVGDDAKFRFTGCPGADIILPVDADYVDGGGGGGDSATAL